MDSTPDVSGSRVEQLLRQQAGHARRRDRIRRVASLAVWPTALVGGNLIAAYGAPGEPDALVSWLLLMLCGLLLFLTGGWWAARQLSSRVPPWPSSVRVARSGAIAAVVVAGIAALLVARTTPPPALTFWLVTVGAVVLLGIRERKLDQQVDHVGYEVMVAAGYR